MRLMHLEVDIALGDWPEASISAARAAGDAAAGLVAVLHGREAALRLSDDADIRTLNKTFRGQDKPTNVLAFPAAPALDMHPLEMPVKAGPADDTIGSDRAAPLGDIILAYETVAAEAAAQGKTFDHHVSHLVVHGLLHLAGYDHGTDEDADEMEALEVRILATLGIPDPYGADQGVAIHG